MIATISNKIKGYLNQMNSSCKQAALGDVIQDLQERSAAVENAEVSGTVKSAVKFEPTASTATASINYHKLFAIGDVTGNTAYGFGDVAKPTTGVMASFGRTVAATSAITDTALDVRAINKLDNSATSYSLQGAYIKAKDYAAAKLANLIGMFVEVVADGTESGSVVGIKIGSDGSTIDNAIDMSSAVTSNGADIKLSSGLTIGSGSAAPTHAAATGSLYIRTGQSDQKAMLYICTVNSGTWVLLNTVTA